MTSYHVTDYVTIKYIEGKMISKVLVIVPAYNEEGSISTVIEELSKYYPQYDYVVVNDGSLDRTSRICKKNGYNLISLPINIGLSGAFQTGMKFAYRNNYDVAIQLDGDGQHDPKYIDEMIQHMERTNADIVIGSRYINNKKSVSLRSFGNVLIGSLIKTTTGKKIYDTTSGMRLYGKRLLAFYAKYMNFDPEPDTIAYLIRCGAKVEEIQVSMRERINGKSYLNISNSIKYMLRTCTSIIFMQWFRKKEDI